MATPIIQKQVKPDPLGKASVELAQSFINAISATMASNTGNVQARNDVPQHMQNLAMALTHYGEAIREGGSAIMIAGRTVHG